MRADIIPPRMLQKYSWLRAAARVSLVAATALLCHDATLACSLTINPRVGLALDQTGQALIEYDMVLEGTPSCAATLEVILFESNGQRRAQPIITCADVGRIVRVTVRDRVSGVSAMGRIDVYDNLGPTLVAPNVTVTCAEDPTAAADAVVVVSDNCTPASLIDIRVVAQTPTAVGCGPVAQAITRTLVAIDGSGRFSAPVTQVITVNRIALAAVAFPANVTLRSSETGLCPDQMLALVPASGPTAGGAPLDPSCKLLTTFRDVTFASCGLSRKIVRAFTVLDCCTNQIRTGTQLIQLLDDVAPAITALPDTLRAFPVDNDCNYGALLPAIAAQDDCDALVSVRVATPFGPLVGNGGALPQNFPLAAAPFAVVYEVRDACGNVARDTTVVAAEDTTPPVPVCDNSTVVAITGDGTVVFARTFDAGQVVNGVYVAASYDNCGAVSFAVRRDTTEDFLPAVVFDCIDVGRVITVQLQVTDEAGNTNVCTVSATIQDKIPPRITPPATFTASCLERPVDTSRAGVPTIVSNCNTLALTGFTDDNTQVNVCGAGFTIRTFTISDQAGGTRTVTQRINFVDTFSVVVPALPDVTLACTATLDLATLNPPTIGTPCVNFLRSPVPDVVSSPNPCGTESIVTFRYTPQCGTDVVSVTQRVLQTDTEAPRFTSAPGSLDRVYTCAADVPTALPVPLATDDCSGAIVTLVADATVRPGGAACPDYVRTLRYTVADQCGNASPTPFEVSIRVRNLTPPTLTLVAPLLTVACAADVPAPDTSAAAVTAVAVCGGPVTVSVSPPLAEPGNTRCAGAFTRTFFVVDACGNSAEATQRIEYRDTVPPTLAPIADGGTFACFADLPAADLSLVSGVDACGDALTVVSATTAPPAGGCRDTVFRTFVAADACGNTASVRQAFVIEDRQAPTLTVPSDRFTFSEENVCGRRLNLTAIATDGCGAGAITFTNDSPFASNNASASATGTYPLDTTVVVFTATDACGNTATDSTVIYIEDIVSPGFRCRPVYIYLDSAGSASVLPAMLVDLLEGNDDCTPRAQLTFEVDLARRFFTCADVGEAFAFEITATDLFGNEGVCRNNVIIDDTLSCPGPLAGGAFAVRGHVSMPLYAVPAADAVVSVAYPGGSRQFATDASGYFVLGHVPGGQLTISAESPLPIGHGLSTFDILLLGRHLLQEAPFSDPLTLLAADVNRSGSVTAYDMTRMRRVILGLDRDFGNGSSGAIALDADHVFSDPRRPWLDRNDWHLAPTLDQDLSDLHLAIVQLGDLNGGNVRPRGYDEFMLADRYVRAGERVTVLVHVGDSPAAGAQLGLVAAGSLEVAAAHAEFDVMSNRVAGVTRVSVLGDLRPGEALLELTFVPERDGLLSELVALDAAFASETYEAGSLSPRAAGLAFGVRRDNLPAGLRAFPNPFADELTIAVTAGGRGVYRYAVVDLAGRGFAERRVEIDGPGLEQFRVVTSDWAPGIYLVVVDGPDGRQVERVTLQR